MVPESQTYKGAKREDELRVLTYNVCWEAMKGDKKIKYGERCAKVYPRCRHNVINICIRDFDIVCLQETNRNLNKEIVNQSKKYACIYSDKSETVAILYNHSKLNPIGDPYGASMFLDQSIIPKGGSIGPHGAILDANGKAVLGAKGKPRTIFAKGRPILAQTFTHIDKPGHIFVVVSIHCPHQKDHDGNPTPHSVSDNVQKCMKEVFKNASQAIVKMEKHLFVCGDFNAERDTKSTPIRLVPVNPKNPNKNNYPPGYEKRNTGWFNEGDPNKKDYKKYSAAVDNILTNTLFASKIETWENSGDLLPLENLNNSELSKFTSDHSPLAASFDLRDVKTITYAVYIRIIPAPAFKNNQHIKAALDSQTRWGGLHITVTKFGIEHDSPGPTNLPRHGGSVTEAVKLCAGIVETPWRPRRSSFVPGHGKINITKSATLDNFSNICKTAMKLKTVTEPGNFHVSIGDTADPNEVIEMLRNYQTKYIIGVAKRTVPPNTVDQWLSNAVELSAKI